MISIHRMFSKCLEQVRGIFQRPFAMVGTGWKGWPATNGPVSALLPQSLHLKESSQCKSPATTSAVCIRILLSPQKCRSQFIHYINCESVLGKLDKVKTRTAGEPGVCPVLHLNRECSQKCIRNIPKPVSHSPRVLVSLEDILVCRLWADMTLE